MIQTVPRVAETGLYNISEAARALGITRKTMRKYADGGFIAFHVRRVNNRRVTTGKEILRLWRGQ